MHSKCLVTCLLVFFLVAGCRKQDEINPTISVTHPLVASSYQYGDYIEIKGLAEDETKLKHVKIELFHSDQNPTGIATELKASSNTFSFSGSLHLDDKYLTSGSYYIKVTAKDKASNTKSTFIAITYSELPLELKDIYVVAKNTPFSYELSKINGNATTYVKSFSGDYSGGVANGRFQQITLAGGNNGDLVTYDPLEDATVWHIAAQNTVHSYFSTIIQSDEDHYIYAALGNSSIDAYDENGEVRVHYTLQQGYYPSKLYHHTDYFLVEREYQFNSDLTVLFDGSGAFVHSLVLNKEIVSIEARNDNEVYIFNTKNGISEMLIYDVENNTTWSPHTIPNGTISDAISITENEVFIAHSDGIQKYTYTNNSMVNIINGVNASRLAYDHLNDRIIAAVGNEIHFYDRLGNLLGIVTHSITVEDVLLYYNK